MDIKKPSDYFELVIAALKSLDGSGRNKEILEKIIELANLSEEEIAELHNGGPQSEVSYQVAWARTYLRSSGYLENSGNSVWSLTDKGYSESIEDNIVSTYRKLKAKEGKKYSRSKKGKVTSTPTSSENIISVNEQINIEEDEWKKELSTILKSLSSSGFEKLCSRIFREKGFEKVKVTGRSGDGGIDGIGVMKLSLVSFKVLFQCKRYKDSVSPKEIREFKGAMTGRAAKGIFLTTGRFTKAAIDEATRDGSEQIELIDGLALCDLLKDLRMGISTREVFIVDNDWFDQYQN